MKVKVTDEDYKSQLNFKVTGEDKFNDDGGFRFASFEGRSLKFKVVDGIWIEGQGDKVRNEDHDEKEKKK